jgi:hypothetical protein
MTGALQVLPVDRLAQAAAPAPNPRPSAEFRPVLPPLTITGMHTQFDLYPHLAYALPRAGGRGPEG